MLGFFKILLFKYSNKETILIGTSISNRKKKEIQNMIGFFVNSLPIKLIFEENDNFISLIKKLNQNILELQENQDIPLEIILKELKLQREFEKNPLFEIFFNFLNQDSDENLKLNDLKIDEVDFDQNDLQISKMFDFVFEIINTQNTIKVNIEYSEKLFSLNTIKRISNHFLKIINKILKNNEIEIKKINISTKEEKQQFIEWNKTEKPNPNKNKVIQEIFEEQVLKTPNNISLIFNDEKLTYKELNEKSNQLGNYLRREFSIKSDDLISIFFEKSNELIISIFGILKVEVHMFQLILNFHKKELNLF